MIHVMLPVQYLRNPSADAATPQRRLMMAVLQAALDDCEGTPAARAVRVPDAPAPRTVREALAYFESRDRSWPFSFDNICDAIGLDAEGVRRTLRSRFADGS